MRGLQGTLSPFRNEVFEYNITEALMLDSMHYMTYKLLKITFVRGNVKMLPSFTQR